MADEKYISERSVSSEKVGNDPDAKVMAQFLYNGRFSVLTILCGLPVLYFGGERLFGVATLCLLAVYFVNITLSDTKSSVVCYIICVVVMQFGILYSIGPLLWHTVFNIILLLLYNFYIILTGGLGLLQFEIFRKEENGFCVNVEYFLFLLYPQTCLIILVWMCSLTFGAYLAPYLFIIFGFPIFHTFLDPKLKCSFTQNDYVLGQPEKLLLTFNFVLAPTLSYVVVNFFSLLHYSSWIAICFSIAVPFFLLTFLDTTDLRDLADIRNNEWQILQILSGCFSLIFGNVLLYIHGVVDGPNAVFVAIILACSILLFVAVKYHCQRMISYISFCLLLLSYLAWFEYTPWTLVFSIGNNIKMSYLAVKLLISLLGALSVLGIILSTSVRYRKFLNQLLVLYTLVFVIVEDILFENANYSVYIVVVTSILMLYMTQRLYYVGYLTKMSSSLCISLHGTKLVCLAATWPVVHEDASHLSSLCCVVGGWLLSYTLTIILLFEHKQRIERRKALVYTGCLLLSLIVLSPTLVRLMWIMVTHSEPSKADIIGFVVVVTGIIAAKITFLHMDDEISRKQSVLVIVLGVLIVMAQPYCNVLEVVSSAPKLVFRELVYDTWQIVVAEYIILPWCFILSAMIVLVLMLKLLPLRKLSPPLFHLTSFFIGAPQGLYFAHMVLPYPLVSSTFLSVPYMISATLIANSILLVFRENGPVRKPKMHVVFLFVSIVSVVIEVAENVNINILQAAIPPSVLFQEILHVIEIVQFKFEYDVQTPLDAKKSSSISSMACNISVAFVVLCGLWFSPKLYYDMTIFIFCGFLLFLNMDDVGLARDRKGTFSFNMITFITSISVSLSARALRQLLPVKFTFWMIIGCLLELCFLFASFLVFLIIILVFWKGNISSVHEKCLVFLSPAFTFLLFYGRTSAGQVLGIVGPPLAYYTFYYPFS